MLKPAGVVLEAIVFVNCVIQKKKGGLSAGGVEVARTLPPTCTRLYEPGGVDHALYARRG
jgi:hypothetical protein